MSHHFSPHQFSTAPWLVRPTSDPECCRHRGLHVP